MVTFDGVNKLIICGAGTTRLNVKEMYSMWKEWMILSDNSKYEPAFKVVGGDPTTGNNIITPYFFLSNGWKIRPQESNHTLRVDGILITDDGSDAFVDTLGVFRVGIQSIVPIYTESVLINTDGGAIQNIPTPSEIADRVWNNSTRELTTSTGIDEVELHTALDNYTNKNDWKANLATVEGKIDSIPHNVWNFVI